MPRLVALVAALAALLAFASSAAAHVTAKTPFVYASSTAELELEVPNELDVAMTALHVSVPSEFRIAGAKSDGDWLPRVTSTTVSWTGGRLPPNAQTTFRLTVDTPATPGAVSFDATQHFAGGGSVSWPVGLTVLPAAESSQQLGRAVVVGLVGLVVLVVLGILLWRRHGSSLQER